MPERAPFTLEIYCALCHGEVTLQFSVQTNDSDRTQHWECPYCSKRNEDCYPYWLAWVTKGHRAEPVA
jgi:hypothetical protein